MKKLILGAAILFLFASCDQVIFPEPQPRKVKPLKEFPQDLQGDYLDHNGDTLQVRDQYISYSDDGLMDFENTYLSDSVVLKYYQGRYFYNIQDYFGDEKFWILYIIEPVEDGKALDVYGMDPGDVVKLAKLQEITSKVRDVEGDDDSDYYLFAPKKRDYKKIISDSIFTKMILFRKISKK